MDYSAPKAKVQQLILSAAVRSDLWQALETSFYSFLDPPDDRSLLYHGVTSERERPRKRVSLSFAAEPESHDRPFSVGEPTDDDG